MLFSPTLIKLNVCAQATTLKIKLKTTASPGQCFSLKLSCVDYSQRDYIEKSPTSFQSVSRGLAIGSAREAKKIKMSNPF